MRSCMQYEPCQSVGLDTCSILIHSTFGKLTIAALFGPDSELASFPFYVT